MLLLGVGYVQPTRAEAVETADSLQAALRAARKSNDRVAEARCLVELSAHARRPDEAYNLLRQALAIADSVGERSLSRRAALALLPIEIRAQHLALALALNARLMLLIDSTAAPHEWLLVKRSEAEGYVLTGEYATAKVRLQDALGFALRHQLIGSLAGLRLRLASCERLTGEVEIAYARVLQLRQDCETQPSACGVPAYAIAEEIGHSLLSMSKPEAVESLWLTALAQATSARDTAFMASLSISLGERYIATGRAQLGARLLEPALAWALSGQDLDLAVRSATAQVSACRSLADEASAYAAYDRLHTLTEHRDSLRAMRAYYHLPEAVSLAQVEAAREIGVTYAWYRGAIQAFIALLMVLVMAVVLMVVILPSMLKT